MKLRSPSTFKMKPMHCCSILILIFLLLSESNYFTQAIRSRLIRRNMQSNSVIPDMLDTAPPHLVHVQWGPDTEAYLGNELTPTKVRYPPDLISWRTERNALYTLIMADLDPPSRQDPQYREVLHWLVVNIPKDEVEKGETFAEYIGSGPPEGTGLHRYVFVVYKQPDVITVARNRTSARSMNGRMGFKTRDFATQYNLGSPVAGNFFQAQYDNYVPILHAQLNATH